MISRTFTWHILIGFKNILLSFFFVISFTDNGLVIILKAYEKWENKQAREPDRLPGLSRLSNKQLFFLNFAQVRQHQTTLKHRLVKLVGLNHHIRPKIKYQVIFF